MPDDDWQSAEEIEAEFGPEGPRAAAEQWISSVIGERQYGAAWKITDPELRLARAQAWVFNNSHFEDVASFDRDELAGALAEEEPTHPLWADFSATELAQFLAAWDDVDLQSWGWGSRPRPIDIDYEVVLLIKLDQPGEITALPEPAMRTAHAFVMHHTDAGWLVAAHTNQRVTPGWPPVF